jgi:hypothetical protein
LQLLHAIEIQLHAKHATANLCNCLRQVAHDMQLHAKHATTNLCNCLRQVAHDMQLHATICMQHVYTVLIYMFIHTYQSSIVAPYVQLSLQLHATNQNMTHV